MEHIHLLKLDRKANIWKCVKCGYTLKDEVFIDKNHPMSTERNNEEDSN